MNNILVIGSLNTDLETSVDHFPETGETLIGGPLQIHCGGKGNNQAIAAAKLGASVTILGAIGNDHFGQLLIENLKKYHVNITPIKTCKQSPTATALIMHTNTDNTIIVTEGANESLSAQDILNAESLIKSHDIILLQQEIPLETQIEAIEIAYRLKKIIVVNPAPSRQLPADIISKISYLLPNEHEIIKKNRFNISPPIPYQPSIQQGRVIHFVAPFAVFFIWDMKKRLKKPCKLLHFRLHALGPKMVCPH